MLARFLIFLGRLYYYIDPKEPPFNQYKPIRMPEIQKGYKRV